MRSFVPSHSALIRRTRSRHGGARQLVCRWQSARLGALRLPSVVVLPVQRVFSSASLALPSRSLLLFLPVFTHFLLHPVLSSLAFWLFAQLLCSSMCVCVCVNLQTSPVSVSAESWRARASTSLPSKSESDALVMDYLVSEGFADAAVSFARETGVQLPSELEGVRRRAAVRSAMVAGDVESVVEMVNDLDPDLLESDASLYLALQRRRFVEAALKGDLDRALELADECLSPLAEENPDELEELEKTFSLLLFERPAESPVADLVDPANRPLEASRLNVAMLTHLGLPHSSKVQQLAPLARWILNRVAERSPLVVRNATGEDDDDDDDSEAGAQADGTGAGETEDDEGGRGGRLGGGTIAAGRVGGGPLSPGSGVGVAPPGTVGGRAGGLGRVPSRGTGWGV